MQNRHTILLLTTVILISIFGCKSTRSYQRYNNLDRGILTNYYNTKVDLGLKFYGDYSFLKKIQNKSNYSSYSDYYKDRNALLFICRTTVSPFFNSIGYVIPGRKPQVYLDNGYRYISSNVLAGEARIFDNIIFKDYLVQLKNSDVLICAWANRQTNMPDITDPNSLKETLEGEFSSIILSGGDSIRYQNPFEIAESSFNNNEFGDYLAAIQALKNNPVSRKDFTAYNFYYQALATYYSFIGDTESVDASLSEISGALAEISGAVSAPDTTDNSLSDFHIHQGLDSLFDFIGNERVVMINESHFRSEHRFLVSEMLPKLKKLGFTHLALETLYEDRKLNRRGFPVQSSGYYTRDVNMANLVRLALSLGFKIVAYDNSSEKREELQATELYNKTLRNNRQGKLVVLAGHSHIDEARVAEGKKWMAAYFKDYSSIDPLTINQERFRGRRKTAAQLTILDPIVKNKHSSDLYLINNYVGKTSRFIDRMYYRIPISLDLSADNKKPILFRVYLQKEVDKVGNPAPVYIISNKIPGFLDLPDGAYVIRIENGASVHYYALNIQNGSGVVGEYTDKKL